MATVANVYAKAIFELAQERGVLDATAQDLKSFVAAYRSGSLADVLASATIEGSTRRAILADILNALSLSPLSRKFIELLASRGRLSFCEEIVSSFESMLERSQGILAGELYSAVELSSEDVATFSATLSKRIGSKIRLEPKVEPELLGGVVAHVAGKTYDASLKSQIERFKNELI